MRRDVGRHADGDARRAVDQEIRNAGRQHDRFGLRAVVVRPERDRALLDLGEHLVRDTRQPALGVAHRGGAVAVERAEVARAVHQWITQRERLRHADQRLVERGVAVGMVASHDVADDLGALPVFGVGRQVLLPHREENAALHRLQAVADVRQRARRDDRERVVQVTALCGLMERDALRRRPVAAAVRRVLRGGRIAKVMTCEIFSRAEVRSKVRSKVKGQRSKVQVPPDILEYLDLPLTSDVTPGPLTSPLTFDL